MNYFKLSNILGKGDLAWFDLPIDKQSVFLKKHDSPKDDIHRSFLQYKAQMLFVPTVKRLAFNFCSFFILPFFLIVAYIKRLIVKFRYKVDAIVERNTHSGVIPSSLVERFSISQKEWATGWSLSWRDTSYMFRLLKYAHRSPYFVFKVAYKTALYSHMIKSFRPNAVIVFNEYSFTSSALTYYCERQNIKHIDVMHGEKLFYIRDSYFRFSNTYVWESYYKDLFTMMKAPEEQFIVELPPFMSIKPSNFINNDYTSDYTYYLARFDEVQIKNIVKSMGFAKVQGKKVMYRPHPRYSNIGLLRKYVDETNIEYPNNVDIMMSVANTRCAIGVYTTVLNQAYHAGKKVIIDDLNFPDIYARLQEFGYSLYSKPIQRLSNIELCNY